MDIAIIFYCRRDIKKYRYLGNWVFNHPPPQMRPLLRRALRLQKAQRNVQLYQRAAQFLYNAAAWPRLPGTLNTTLDAAPHAWSGQAAAAGLVGAECGRG